MKKKQYKAELHELQIELVKLQRDVIDNDRKLLVLIEGRDAAGKDGLIKRIIQHLSPRETRVVALGKPSDRDRTLWYFQRFVPHLPAAQEIVLFNRSWYNRAGVERVMGFCTPDEYERFMRQVIEFERMLIASGIHLFKYYLDISRAEQAERMDERRTDPLKTWKISPVDAAALDHWDQYSEARDEMFRRTNSPDTPWYVVHADSKKQARLNVIKHLLNNVEYEGKDSISEADPSIVFKFNEALLHNNTIER